MGKNRQLNDRVKCSQQRYLGRSRGSEDIDKTSEVFNYSYVGLYYLNYSMSDRTTLRILIPRD